MNSTTYREIFNQAIADYHVKDEVDQVLSNPYPADDFKSLLYQKIWIDTVQWHLEDIIRDPNIVPEDALVIKRRIDHSNQNRTDLVERIDSYYVNKYKDVQKKTDARMNTESIGWALDRFAILALKVYHMKEEANRKEASSEHQEACAKKLLILEEQSLDLGSSIDHLMEDVGNGIRFTKVYHQMKMYNDPNLNPILYSQK